MQLPVRVPSGGPRLPLPRLALSPLASSSLPPSTLWQDLAFLVPSGLGCVNVSIPVPLLPADFGPSQWPSESPCQPVSPYVAGRELAQTLGVACHLGLRSRGPVGARPGSQSLPTTWGLGRRGWQHGLLLLWMGIGPPPPSCGPDSNSRNCPECLLWLLGKITSLEDEKGFHSASLGPSKVWSFSVSLGHTCGHTHTPPASRHSAVGPGAPLPHTVGYVAPAGAEHPASPAIPTAFVGISACLGARQAIIIPI